jgi:ATP citrate (pro-S)-lyase
MARVKISEFLAKSTLLPKYLGLPATPTTTIEEIEAVFPNQNLVVKVDQGIKKRGKQGLVKVNVTPNEIPGIVQDWSKQGWSNFLIEPVLEHDESVEHYLALERVRTRWQISYSEKGGVEVESSWDQVKTFMYPETSLSKPVDEFISKIIPTLEKNHMVFLEMNPILLRGEVVIPLDMAAEVDSAGTSLVSIPDRTLSDSEKAVAELDASTPASLKFKIINPEGRIWMLLSGGGASLVLADEVADQGMGKELANYGEYSGAPTDDDVYAYTKIILKQLLSSNSARPKAIVVAGGVANFTDVAKTFKGLIRALDEKKSELVEAKVKVYVRRGGPNEIKGLKMMENFLSESGLLGSVHGHAEPLTLVVNEVKEYLS